MSTNSEKDAELLALFNRGYNENRAALYTERNAAGLRALAAAAWQEGWNQGFRDFQSRQVDDDGYDVITPTPSPYANALITTKETEK